MRFLLHGVVFVLLTVVTQLGGVAWLLALAFRRRLLAFAGLYLGLVLLAIGVAPLLGRVPISCGGEGPLRMQSWFYCVSNRSYVVPELAAVAGDLAAGVARRHPGTVTLALDGGFPFGPGFPLLPHLSHDDGRKLDLALYYMDGQGAYLPGATRSPLGYFAFEPGASTCPPGRWGLRWNLDWLQPLWPDHQPEPTRMAALLTLLAQEPRIGRVFLEPHLVRRFGVNSAKFGFQGCRAARHDDHIHIQL